MSKFDEDMDRLRLVAKRLNESVLMAEAEIQAFEEALRGVNVNVEVETTEILSVCYGRCRNSKNVGVFVHSFSAATQTPWRECTSDEKILIYSSLDKLVAAIEAKFASIEAKAKKLDEIMKDYFGVKSD